ncbi:hypothetical protein EB796_025270 [Bugula neritina]|uniref:Uncharacterized protein n=1 Tax=Bugula neritina TaxID=10212 RepID=A0A7J7IR64_BUGNE|nr:hypothetical protein EB796_025270 [Bugula neritina]
MHFLVGAAILVLGIASSSLGTVLQSGRAELDNYDLRIQILHDLLAVECPELDYYKKSRPSKRVLANTEHGTILNADKTVYTRLYLQLVACRNAKRAHIRHTTPKPTLLPRTTRRTTLKPRTTKRTTPKPPTTKRTTPKPRSTTRRPTTTTVDPNQPIECREAETFTEPWRLEHNGQDIKGNGSHNYNGYACDLHADTRWFRFGGAAGNRLLDSCPKYKSCGSLYPLWSDEPMPTKVGVVSTIKMYAVVGNNCKKAALDLQVMRCSPRKNDYIYVTAKPSVKKNYKCSDAFCGMK